jgi:hypothetical protein
MVKLSEYGESTFVDVSPKKLDSILRTLPNPYQLPFFLPPPTNTE